MSDTVAKSIVVGGLALISALCFMRVIVYESPFNRFYTVCGVIFGALTILLMGVK